MYVLVRYKSVLDYYDVNYNDLINKYVLGLKFYFDI